MNDRQLKKFVQRFDFWHVRPGEPNYNYGWTPPEGQVPYSPPWPGGAPLTAVDRVEAVAEELGNEANAAVHVAEEPCLLNFDKMCDSS